MIASLHIVEGNWRDLAVEFIDVGEELLEVEPLLLSSVELLPVRDVLCHYLVARLQIVYELNQRRVLWLVQNCHGRLEGVKRRQQELKAHKLLLLYHVD
jgi:hypothetical protein